MFLNDTGGHSMTSRLIPRRVFSINLLTGLLLCLGAAPVIAVEQAPDQFIQTMSNEILDMVRKDPALKAGDLQKIGLLVDTKLLTLRHELAIDGDASASVKIESITIAAPLIGKQINATTLMNFFLCVCVKKNTLK